MSLASEPYERISSGRKTVEVRLLDEKRKKLTVGDEIVFYKLPDRIECVEVKVTQLRRFSSFKELFVILGKNVFGHSESMTLEKQVNDMYEHYSPEDEQKFSVLAIYFQKSK